MVYIYRILGICIFLFLWQLLVMSWYRNILLLPSLTSIIYEFGSIVVEYESYLHIWSTLLYSGCWFLVAIIIGVPIWILIWSSAVLKEIFDIPIQFFRSLPATAIFPVFLLFFGITNISKVALAAFVCLRIIIMSTMSGVQHIPQTRLRVMKVLGIRWWQRYKQLFYSSLPHIYVWVKTCSAMSLIVVIVTEVFVGTSYGLWQQLYDAYIIYDTPRLFARVLIAGMLWYFINKWVMLLEKDIIHW